MRKGLTYMFHFLYQLDSSSPLRKPRCNSHLCVWDVYLLSAKLVVSTQAVHPSSRINESTCIKFPPSTKSDCINKRGLQGYCLSLFRESMKARFSISSRVYSNVSTRSWETVTIKAIVCEDHCWFLQGVTICCKGDVMDFNDKTSSFRLNHWKESWGQGFINT
ncbi:hypothetical protein GOP47_0008786 [Adiantum capillus-veneris]|uniref:Uncharacterized protein n=1 Tax=Adiantum capillus-veneris TaxID=13818 RepID=A0A9D4ZKQ7_ADICA|nr:hypothetical protein GOP47_0008786 [Adiantum capillus-veneris]